MDQNEYVENIEQVLVSSQRAVDKEEVLQPAEYTLMRTIAGKLNWVVQGTRPDMAFEHIEISTKFKSGSFGDLIRAIKAISRLKESDSVVRFPALGDISTWKIIVFTDAAHANMSDKVSSMGAHIVLLVDGHKQCCPLAWHASKIKRVVRSTLAAETLSLVEGLETGLYQRELLSEFTGRKGFPIIGYVDNKSVTQALNSTKMVDDKCLRVDIGALKEMLGTGKVQSVKWCTGEMQLANCLTKRGASPHLLKKTLQTGLLDIAGIDV